MSGGTLLGLSESLLVATNSLRSECMITALDPRTDQERETFVFQYFPESISSSKAVNYTPVDVPGGSLPVYQWISSGEHSISFTAVFSTDMDFEGISGGKSSNSYGTLERAGLQRANPDIRTVVAYLRSFMLPIYDGETSNDQGRPITYPPRKLRLDLPNTGIGASGGYIAGNAEVLRDSLFCVMTTCDIEYQAFFPSGLPRLITVSLSFAQIANVRGRVSYPQSMVAAAADFDNSSNPNIGARNPLVVGAAALKFFPYTIARRDDKTTGGTGD